MVDPRDAILATLILDIGHGQHKARPTTTATTDQRWRGVQPLGEAEPVVEAVDDL